MTFWQHYKPWTATKFVREMGRIRTEQMRPTSNLEVPQYFEAIVGELQKNSFDTVVYEEQSGRGQSVSGTGKKQP